MEIETQAEHKVKIQNIIKHLEDGNYTTKPKVKFTAECWKTFVEIFDQKQCVVKEYVKCSICHVIMVFDVNKGTNRLNRHLKKHLDQQADETPRINTLFKATPEQRKFSDVTRESVKRASIAYIVKDSHSFNKIEGEGLLCLLVLFTRIGNRIGELSKDEVKNLLPGRQMVIIFGLSWKTAVSQ